MRHLSFKSMSLLEYTLVGTATSLVIGTYPCYLISENAKKGHNCLDACLYASSYSLMFVFPVIGATLGASAYEIKRIFI